MLTRARKRVTRACSFLCLESSASRVESSTLLAPCMSVVDVGGGCRPPLLPGRAYSAFLGRFFGGLGGGGMDLAYSSCFLRISRLRSSSSFWKKIRNNVNCRPTLMSIFSSTCGLIFPLFMYRTASAKFFLLSYLRVS